MYQRRVMTYWTQQELDLLKSQIASGVRTKDIIIPGRTQQGIVKRIGKLNRGIHTIVKHQWTDSERVQIVAQARMGIPAKKMYIPNRSYSGIQKEWERMREEFEHDLPKLFSRYS